VDAGSSRKARNDRNGDNHNDSPRLRNPGLVREIREIRGRILQMRNPELSGRSVRAITCDPHHITEQPH